MSVFVDEPVKPGWLELRPFIQTGHLLAAVGLVGGRNFRYLREFVAQAATLGADGVRCVPLFDGTPADTGERARFEGLTAANFTPGNLARARRSTRRAQRSSATNIPAEAGASCHTNDRVLLPRIRSQTLRPISRPAVRVSHGHDYQSSRLYTVDEAVGEATEQETPRAVTIRRACVRGLGDRLRCCLELGDESGCRYRAALGIPAGRFFCLGKRGVEVLKIPSHDQRPRLFGDAPPPMALFWLVRRSTAVTVAESRPTRPLRHRHRSGGQGSRSTARRAPPVPRRAVGVPLRAADQSSFQSDRSIGTASSCRVEPCSHVFGCGQQIGCECSPAETVSWTSRRNTQVPSLT